MKGTETVVDIALDIFQKIITRMMNSNPVIHKVVLKISIFQGYSEISVHFLDSQLKTANSRPDSCLTDGKNLVNTQQPLLNNSIWQPV